MYYLHLQTVILLFGISLVCGISHLSHQDFLLENYEYLDPHGFPLPNDPTHWIEQRVDHFNNSDLRTWKQKYYQIMSSWKPEGPILLYLNGEGPMDQIKIEKTYLRDRGGESQSLIGQIAEETGAAYFMLEHRYYGASQPLDESTENLTFLSSRQALADAAHLLTTIKEYVEFKNSKVMVVGGSYAGNLAAWMKLLYPELVDAVLSSSAPVLAKKDFKEYFETVTDTFRTYGSQECVNKITEKFNDIRELFQSPGGIEELKDEYHICEDDDMTVLQNQQVFFDGLINKLSVTAQYGTPDDISSRCQNLIEQGKWFSIVKDLDKDCERNDFKSYIRIFKSGKSRSWLYQTCTEFGYFQSTSSNKQMFGNVVPVDFYYNTCKMVFGEEFNEERVDQGIINTNRMYEGLTPNVTNVVFVNGDMDPWHRLGILHNLSADTPAIYIKNSSHCHDFRPDSKDTDNVKEARKRIKSLIKKWIGQA